MHFTSLPGTSLNTSVLGLGTGPFGSDVSTDESFAMLDAFAEAGGNFADTAHIYAAWLPDGAGQSERTLGQWLRSRRPHNFIVGTKGGHPHLETMDISRLTPECITHDLEESLDRLDLDRVDLYWLHRDNPAMPVDEIMQALNEHVHAGRVGDLGASNWSPERIAAANDAAERRGLTGFCASQIGWNLATLKPQAAGMAGTLHMDDATLSWHRTTGFPAIAYSAQAGGYFAHSLPTEGHEPTGKQHSLAVNYGTPENELRHSRAHQLGLRLNRSANEVALAYLWSQPFPAVALIGPRRVEQLRDSLQAATLRLSAEDIAFLEAV